MERFAIKIDKKLKANLYKICRLCGIDNPDMVPILSDKPEDKKENAIDVEAELEMSQKINLLIGLSITKDDKMPQTMCCLCVDKINDFYEFREMCYATNAQTRKLLGLKNVKKPVVDIKPKVEVKEESIVPTPAVTPAANKNGNRKRKSDEVALKEETPSTPVVLPKKKLRFSTPAEPAVKEETPVVTKKKLRFTAINEEPTPPPAAAGSNKKSKTAAVEDSKLKKEPSPPIPAPPPAVSNKKLRLAAPPQKELASKKSKQKSGKSAEQKDADVKEEIKEEIKEEPAAAATAPAPSPKVPPAPKLKFGCNICKERFAAKVNLEAHTRTTHLPKVERYVCTACNEVLSKSFDIKNHQLWHKLSKTPYVCGCCGESILNTYAFSRHLREHGFETPPALLVLDRECPQCHTSYATNFLYNIHICAVKTRRCAGCNRLQRNEAEYLKHSAQCAKVYLNYSKHIMPSVEALEDAVRIKNENDVEAAAEEMARISGVPLDMAPVVQLTRLSSPIIMAANQCVSMTGLDDAASTSSKKSGKKGVSKKDLKRVDELLKSTLDALVSIKHEPEVHVEPETPCAGVHSDNDDHNEGHEEARADDAVGGLDDFHHNDDDTDNEEQSAAAQVSGATDTNVLSTDSAGVEQIKIKQEVDETNEENSNKIGGGLKLKIKKEHGQLNSSIIEQQKSSEKRAEKRKKKKKHKDKEKDKQKLAKDMLDEQLSQDSHANNVNSEENVGTPVIRIKAEPQDEGDAGNIAVAPSVQIRPQPEATIMTSIPMMQFQIACVSSGVEFNNGSTGSVTETQISAVPTTNREAEPEDIKPNREELDRMLKISHVSSGIAMETEETEESEEQPMDHDGNVEGEEEDDYHEESNEDDHHDNEDNESEQQQDDNHFDHVDEDQDDNEKEDNGVNNDEIIAKKIKKPILKPKSKLTLKSNVKSTPTTITKSRNKACKSTAKSQNMPVLQISAVCSGVSLEPSEPSVSEFTPIFIKPEPQNRGYSDEQPAVAVEAPLPPPPQPEVPEETEELSQTHTAEEQNYISSIDFNNITIKQEKDIEISDVQITQKSIKSFANVNGIKRKRKHVRRTHVAKDKSSEINHERLENKDENMEEEENEPDTDEEVEEENNDEESEEEEAEEEEEEDDEEAEEEEDEEELEEEEEEEREYRELEYPPELVDKNTEIETGEKEVETKEDENQESKQILDNAAQVNVNLMKNNHDTTADLESVTATITPPDETPSFVIASVCSQAVLSISDNIQHPNQDLDDAKLSDVNIEDPANHDNTLTSTILSDENCEGDANKLQTPAVDIVSANTSSQNIIEQGIAEKHLTADAGSCNSTDPNLNETLLNLNTSMATNATTAENTQSLAPTLPTETLLENVNTNEISLQLGQPFEVRSDGEITEALNSRQELHISDPSIEATQVTQHSEEHLHSIGPLTQEQISLNQGTQELQINPQENLGQECNQDVQGQQLDLQDNLQYSTQQDDLNPQNNLQNSVQGDQECNRPSTAEGTQIDQLHRLDSQDQQQQQLTPYVLEETLQNTHNNESQTQQTSQNLQPVFKISSVTSSAVLDITPEFNHNPISNNDEEEILKDNQEGSATIEGVVEQAKELNLEAQPVAETTQNKHDHETEVDENEDDDNEYDGNEDELEEEDVEDENENDGENDPSQGNNLEERQNYQNQEVLSQIRPAALALHPYLEDISSSSNSLLSNSLSQTPPPAQLVSTSTDQTQQQRLLNTEETENILNESNDVLSRSSSEVAATSAQQHLAQQLPPHMPTFNFDNINEIAENNNNANIEREQLQDEQQQQQQNPNQQPTTNTQ